MKFFLTVLILAFLGDSVFGARILNQKKNKKHNDDFGGDFDFNAIDNASSENISTSGQTMAMGKGETRISSSIGHAGTINNLKAEKGGKAASSLKQVNSKAASSKSLVKDAHGNVKAIENASAEKNKVQGANQQAFLGKGAASSGLSDKGIVSDVYGKKGAADASSWSGVRDAKASSKLAAKKNHKKHAKKHFKKAPKKHHKKAPKKHVKKAAKKYVGASNEE